MPAYSSAAMNAASFPIGIAGAPILARSFSSSTESLASSSNFRSLFSAITWLTRLAFPVEMLFAFACWSSSTLASTVWLRIDALDAWAWRTASTAPVSSCWSLTARAWSLSSTEIMMAEEMLSR